MKEMPAPDLLIFDIDGVLLDVRRSFPEVIRGAVFEGWQRFCGGDSDCQVYDSAHERVMKKKASLASMTQASPFRQNSLICR